MRNFLAGIGSALVLLAPLHAAAQDDNVPGGFGDSDLGSHIQPGAPPKTPPLKREKFDQAVARLFKQADANNDGTVTLAEFNAVIDARKATIIGQRFQTIDADGDKSISLAEFTQWQRSLGSLVLADRGSGQQAVAIVPEVLAYQPGRGDNEDIIARLIEPLSATLIVAANTDYDAGASLAEVTAYEDKHFAAADLNHDGYLTSDESARLVK